MSTKNPGKWTRSDVHRAGLLMFFRQPSVEAQVEWLKDVAKYEQSEAMAAAVERAKLEVRPTGDQVKVPKKKAASG